MAGGDFTDADRTEVREFYGHGHEWFTDEDIDAVLRIATRHGKGRGRGSPKVTAARLLLRISFTMRPGVFLREELVARGIPEPMACRMIARQSRGAVNAAEIQGVITGAIPISEVIAAALQEFLGTSAQLWLNLEHSYRVGLKAGKKDVSHD